MKSHLRIIVLSILLTTQAVFASEPRIETLIGFVQDQHGFVFQVYTGGCTSKDDFRLNAVQNDEGVMEMSLFRIRPDFCKGMFRFGKFVRYSYYELKLQNTETFEIMNPINPGFKY